MARKSRPNPNRVRKAAASSESEGRGGTQDIWKGSISFGLVEIPVALVAAERPQEVKLSYLDRRDFSPVGYKRYNKKTEKEVPWSEIVRGYEHEKGEYVVLTPQDLERASPELSRTIQILHFVDSAEIEPIYYDRPYYLEPLKPRSKGYVLLRETLRRTGKVGIARVAIRTREHVAAVGVRDGALVLFLLRFPNELRPTSQLDNVSASLADAHVSPKEIEIAERLVEDMAGDWDPKEFSDEYASDLMKLIRSRVASGKTHVLDETEAEVPRKRASEVADLMPLLQRSLAAARGGGNGRRSSASGRTSRTRSRARERAPATRRGARRRA